MPKHSKYKNTGIIFELLIRQITTDILNEDTSKAASLLKKHFSKTELGKEYKLYELISKNQALTEGKATIVLNTAVDMANKLDKILLKKQKYKLIKEIKENYGEDFFKTRLNNYKIYAAFSNLLEDNKADFIIQNKTTLIEHLTSPKIIKPKEEFDNLNKDLRILTYRVLLEKFNEKYSSLNDKQKILLREYISNIDNIDRLNNLYNKEIKIIKESLSKIKTKDETINIKLNETINILTEQKEVKEQDLINLLQYYDLIDELNKANG